MTGRKKHAQRAMYRNKKKYIPVGTPSPSMMNLINNTKKADRPGLIARLFASLFKTPRESRTKKEES